MAAETPGTGVYRYRDRYGRVRQVGNEQSADTVPASPGRVQTMPRVLPASTGLCRHTVRRRAGRSVRLSLSIAALSLALSLLIPAGCSTDIRAGRADRDASEDSYPVFTVVREGGLNYDTVNFLALHGFSERFSADPDGVLRELYHHGPELEVRQIWDFIADLSFYQAHREDDADKKAAYFLTAAQAAWKAMFQKDSQVSHIQTWHLYNHSVRNIFEYLREQGNLLNAGHTIVPICGPEVIFAPPVNKLAMPLDTYKLMEICADWEPRNHQVFSFRRGLGVPLILHAPAKVTAGHEAQLLRTPLFEPATVFLRFGEESGGNMPARWEFADTMLFESISHRGVKAPLAMDITTPLAYALNQPNPFKDIYFMFNPAKMADLAGLYMTQPWDPRKIPVVMTHGLLSNPRTWAQMLNSLYLDPRIRRHCQFWLFAYPTGNPILFSAFCLRSALQEAETHFGTGNANFHRMVLIGHSMGGLLSKTMITNTGDNLKNLLLEGREENLKKLSPAQREQVEKILNFKRPEYIKRVLFLATPHRGSKIASWSIMHFFARSISLPARFFDSLRQSIVDIGLLPNTDAVYIRTGIDNLAPDDRILMKLNELDFHTVPFHSIIGDETGHGIKGGTDGVVPYASSHLEKSVSELIVQSSHSVQKQSQAIAEVNRILIEHLIQHGHLAPDGSELPAEPAAFPEEPFPAEYRDAE